MNTKSEYNPEYHTLSCQTIRITLFVYVYVRVFAPETCVLDIFLNPLFYFLDGMALKIEEGKTFLHFIYRKFRTFIVPYFFLALLLVLLDTLLLPLEGMNMNLAYLRDSFIGIFRESRVYSLWYLPSLFFGETIVYLSEKITKESFIRKTASLILILTLTLLYNAFLTYKLPLALDTSFIGSFYLYLGYLLMHEKAKKLRDFLFRSRLNSLIVAILLLSISTVFALLIYKHYGVSFSGSKNQYSPYYFILPASLIGTMGIVFLGYSIRNKVFHHIGGMTMIILAFEEEVWIKIYKNLIARNWYQAFENYPRIWNIEEITCCFLGALFAVLLSVPLYYFFMKTPLCVIFNRKYQKTLTNT